MNKSILFLLLMVLAMACQSKKTDAPAEEAQVTEASPAAATETAPAAVALSPEIWNSELGARLKADYKENPANQAETDQNLILEYAVQNNLDVKRTPSGLYYIMEKEGVGKSPKSENVVSVNYRGYFLDGNEFDSSYKRNAPIQLPANQFVPGWTEALTMMKPGGKMKVLVPSHLAYGPVGYPGAIPGNAVLGFDMELLKVVQ
jgi:FKBP-type peptidyl-prolyl cis-trans isomerase